MWSSEVTNMIIAGIGETLYMTLVSTIAGYIIGLPMGIVLTVTDKDGIRPNALVYKILDVIVNIVRSIPFMVLLQRSFHWLWQQHLTLREWLSLP